MNYELPIPVGAAALPDGSQGTVKGSYVADLIADSEPHIIHSTVYTSAKTVQESAFLL